jgi:hypothetical protein
MKFFDAEKNKVLSFKNTDNKPYIPVLTAGEVAALIGRSTQTLRIWYQFQGWCDENRISLPIRLPEQIKIPGGRISFYYTKDMLPIFEKFRDYVNETNIMSEFNNKFRWTYTSENPWKRLERRQRG